MLSVYTNQTDLLKATSTTEVSRLESIDRQLLDIRNFSVTFKDNSRPKLELHVYTPDGIYLTGNHNTLFTIEDNNNQRSVSPRVQSRVNFQEDTFAVAYKHLAIDSVKELETLGINKGQYKLVYNLFDNVLGGFDSQQAFIKEISPSRRELRLQLADYTNLELVSQLQALRDRWADLSSNNDVFDSFVLNFGFNETYQIINFRFEIDFSTTPEIFIKLYEPLPAKYGEKSKVFISEEIITPFLDSISIIPEFIPEPVTTLAGPNFDLDQYEGGSVATTFKSWNDLLATNAPTSQQIIDNYFSGSLSGIKLNINYRYFDNFVHYGSAVERVKNFKYKLELIEYYTQQITTILSINNAAGSAVSTNLSDLYSKRNKIVSSFDDFEKYLFFESNESKLYSFYDVSSSYGISDPITPWPKNSSIPFTASNIIASTWLEAYELWSQAITQWNPDLYGHFFSQESVNSEVAQNYYDGLLEIATIYDKFNVHALQNTIPAYIQNSEDGDQYVLFVNMMSQHFDILWSYIKNLTLIHTREEHPKDGMSNDLLYHVASSMGFELLNGKSTSELWKYSLGVDADGYPLQSDINGITSISDENNTKEIWRRIVNNLPYILKSKGTSRSIKALLSCFGIPSTILTIKEYGGPSTFTDNDHFPEYIHDVYHYAYYLSGSEGTIEMPISQYDNGIGSIVPANVLEFRFKTDSNYTYNVGSYYGITKITNQGSLDSYTLVLSKETNDDNEGTLTLFSTATGDAVSASNLEIFDDSWHSVIIQESNGSASLKVAKTLYGNKIYIKSASFSDSQYIFPTASIDSINFGFSSSYTPSITLPNGNSITAVNRFNGHLHEIRLWSGSLNDATIIEHAASPSTYTYNVDRVALSTGTEAGKPYDHLLQRFTLANTVILSGSFYQTSAHPKQNKNTGSLYFIGYTDSESIKFEGFEETYYTPSPSLGGSSLYTNKVRIESASIESNKRLNTKTRVEKSSYDRYSLDSNRLGVYFSPQTAINEDIFNQLGYFEIDDYIGNPGDDYNSHYTDLNNFAIQYWKKYENRNDFEAYFRALEIYDFTLFKYIKQLLPQRSNAIVGLVIEPNVLERSKVKLLNKPVIEDLVKNAVIEDIDPVLTSEYSLINAVIEDVPPVLTSEYSLINAVIEDTEPVLTSEYSLISASIEDIEPDLTSEYSLINVNFLISPSLSSSYQTVAASDFDDTFTYDIGFSSTIDSVRIGEIAYSRDISSTVNTFTGVILDAINTDRVGTGWVQNRYIGAYVVSEDASYRPANITILNSRPSTYLLTLDQRFYRTAASASVDNAYSSSLKIADINLSLAAGWNNARYNGSKLTGPGININSPSTVDGGPVVKVKQVSPNQIIFSSNQITTVDQSATGVKSKTL